LAEVPKQKPKAGEVLVRIQAAALNHRDLFIRQHLYPGIALDRPMFADGYGTIIELGPDCARAKDWLHRSVILMPARGWESNPDGPEDPRKYTLSGSSKTSPIGMGQEYVAISEEDIELAPAHLRPEEGAALPVVGLTGWRALVTKSGNARPGRNILITGVGGGVALQTLQFAVAIGCNVFVTSGDDAKLAKAKQIGAKGGVSYRQDDWDKQLRSQLPEDRPFLDAVIDGAGGNIVSKTVRLLKAGGVIVTYGSKFETAVAPCSIGRYIAKTQVVTLSPSMAYNVPAMLQNIELRGSTMGSKKEFREMVQFVSDRKLRPVVSRVVKGLQDLEAIDGLFEEMKTGKQFGKLVIEVAEPSLPRASRL
jgi:NADPH:quinone reductase-like Zn-dependent oxidoreductase